MIYTSQNARGSRVIDLDANREISRVLAVNTKTGGVKVACEPLRLDEFGDKAAAEIIRFRSISPIQGSEPRPVLFHCYGRLDS